MTIYVSQSPDGTLYVQRRAESGTVIGDTTKEVREGDTFNGMTYRDLLELGIGEHTLGDE